MSKTRDKVVHSLVNFIINTFASKEYKSFITVVNGMGLNKLDDTVDGWLDEERPTNPSEMQDWQSRKDQLAKLRASHPQFL